MIIGTEERIDRNGTIDRRAHSEHSKPPHHPAAAVLRFIFFTSASILFAVLLYQKYGPKFFKLAIILLLVGGLIAFFGDRLGTYVGKKRLTALRLRPRHTAVLYTSVSGGLIAVLTLILLTSIDANFRRALLEGDLLNQRIVQSRHDLAQTQTDLMAETTSNTMLKQSEQEAVDEYTTANNRRGLAVSKEEAEEQRLQKTHHQLQRSEEEVEQARASLAGSRAILAAKRLELKTTLQELAENVAQLHRGVEIADGMAKQNLRLSQQIADLEAKRENLQTANQILQTQKQELVSNNSSLTSQIAGLTSTKDTLTADNAALLQTNEDLVRRNSKMTNNGIIYRNQSELGRRVVAAGQSLEQTRTQVLAFLNEISANALDNGAQLGSNGRAVLCETPDVTGGLLPSLTEEDNITLLANSIASAKTGEIVLRAVAKGNSFYGDQVKILVKLNDNKRIFHAGEMLASQRIDGAVKNELLIWTQLQHFLRDQIQPLAKKRNMIPLEDAQTGDITYGQISEDEATSLVKQIQDAGSRARVTAFAKTDAFTVGPLVLDLQVTADSHGNNKSPSF